MNHKNFEYVKSLSRSTSKPMSPQSMNTTKDTNMKAKNNHPDTSRKLLKRMKVWKKLTKKLTRPLNSSNFKSHSPHRNAQSRSTYLDGYNVGKNDTGNQIFSLLGSLKAKMKQMEVSQHVGLDRNDVHRDGNVKNNR